MFFAEDVEKKLTRLHENLGYKKQTEILCIEAPYINLADKVDVLPKDLINIVNQYYTYSIKFSLDAITKKIIEYTDNRFITRTENIYQICINRVFSAIIMFTTTEGSIQYKKCYTKIADNIAITKYLQVPMRNNIKPSDEYYTFALSAFQSDITPQNAQIINQEKLREIEEIIQKTSDILLKIISK